MAEQDQKDQIILDQLRQIEEFSAQHPRVFDESRGALRVFTYGTAGFRMHADYLESVVYRVGLLAALRSRNLDGSTIGVMITASHNPPEDNGVKLIDPQGEMLEASWEAFATKFANADSDVDLARAYLDLSESLNINLEKPANVVYARDTRASGPALAAALKDGLTASGAAMTNYEVLTTPQLHYIVKSINTASTPTPYGEPNEMGYYAKLSDAFAAVMADKGPAIVTVDAANGVGGTQLRKLADSIDDKFLQINIVNNASDSPEKLNALCGADFVKTQQTLPAGTEPVPLALHASLDGDADRIVFYYVDQAKRFFLLDGDKIASLAAMFIQELLVQAGLQNKIRVGVVQTAYANGSSTRYIQEVLKVPVTVTPTGVKHLHHAAQQYDVGVYFEANGHGTVLFSAAAARELASFEAQSPGQQSAVTNLARLIDVINQTVGDAMSDLLLVVTILAHKAWGPADWNSAYTDLPNRLVRVVVRDRFGFKTEDAERRLVEPVGVQAQIDDLVNKYKLGRSFVRASGTEDAVRVYAEAETRLEADELALKVADLVKNY
ncbi:uncharacterized protein V1516DRAFT_668006 [Lipomyces oligophaga]|uniref:uncharacterized protein n=1 Tax=Lipomyces oligophaga TaxID=45792 RepID=UPI0034CED8E0